jgi:RNA polymerase sigma factor (sigma-70 family)
MMRAGKEASAAENMDAAVDRVVSTEEFEQFFKHHWPRLVAIITRVTHDGAKAEELVQESMYRLHRWRRFVHNPERWVYRVAIRLALNLVRSEARRARLEKSWAAPTASPADQEASVQAKQQSRLIGRVLADMRTREARLLILRYSGLSFREIAALLGISPLSVGTMLDRAERNFEKKYRALVKPGDLPASGDKTCI